MAEEYKPQADLAEKLNFLISRIHPPGREYTLIEIAAGIHEKTGISVTPAYLGQLRAGKAANPSQRILTGLARFFGTPVEYFFDESVAGKVREEVELMAALRDAATRNVALRLPELTQGELAGVAALIDALIRNREKGNTSGR